MTGNIGVSSLLNGAKVSGPEGAADMVGTVKFIKFTHLEEIRALVELLEAGIYTDDHGNILVLEPKDKTSVRKFGEVGGVIKEKPVHFSLTQYMNQLEKFIERSSQNAFSYIADGAVARQDVLGASSVVEVLFVPKLALALKDITDNPDMMTSYEKRIYQCHYLLRRAFEIHNDLHKMEIGAPEVGGNIGSPKVVSAGPVPEVGQVKQ